MPKSDRIIIDTNLWISFLLTKDYSKLDKLFSTNNLILLFSPELLEEFIEIARRPKFKKYFAVADLESLLGEIHLKAEFFEVTSEINICRDPKDDFLLSLSQDGYATHVITGDKDLLEIKMFGETLILTITEYLGNNNF
jgi:putative PIN family toxin of toxin-antitoxin system